MKKILIIICLNVLFTSMPMSTAIIPSISEYQQIDQYIYAKTDQVNGDPPDWATGYFVGVIGVTNQMGKPGPRRGHIIGYYEKEGFKGKFAGVIARRNSTEASGFIGGYLSGRYMIGIMGNISTRENSPIVGIGVNNETHMYYRLMGLVGPTFYIAGKYHPL
jgi:hypothetical protein